MVNWLHTKIERQGRLIGGGIALLFHLVVALFFFTTGFRTIYPIPQNEGILVELMLEPTPPIIPHAIPGEEPRALMPDPNQEMRLVQQATHVEEVLSQARTQQSTLGESGDVALFEPEPPKPINERALFRSRDTGDSLAEQSSRVVGATMQAGAPDGNTREGNPDGTPVARLQGRTSDGALPLPEYNKANIGGTVIVRISVDQYGKVTNANVTQTGTTVQDRTLWDAAVEAAKLAKFNTSGTAPIVQEGTITYLFVLK